MTRPSGPRPPCPEDSAMAATPCPLGDPGCGPRLPLWSAPVLTWGDSSSCVGGRALTLACWADTGMWVMTPCYPIPGVAPLTTQRPGASGLPFPRTVGLGGHPHLSQAGATFAFLQSCPRNLWPGRTRPGHLPSSGWVVVPGSGGARGSGLCPVCWAWAWWHLGGGLRFQVQISAPPQDGQGCTLHPQRKADCGMWGREGA